MRLMPTTAMVAICGCACAASADSLNLSPPQGADTRPDFATGFVTTSFDGTTLTMNGFTASLRQGAMQTDYNPNELFALSADFAGGNLVSGSFSIGALLTADIVEFCAEEGLGAQFLATVTGGSEAGTFGGVGASVGSLFTETEFGSLATAFDGTSGVLDTFAQRVIPMPAAGLMAGAGLLVAGVRRRRCV